MKKLLLLTLSLLLIGCASAGKIKESWQWLGAEKYIVELKQKKSIPQGDIFLQFNKNPITTNNDIAKLENDALVSILNKHGYSLSPKRENANHTIVASINSEGPTTKTRTSAKAGEIRCDSSGKNCFPRETILTEKSYSVCSYTLEIKLVEHASNENIFSFSTGWKSEIEGSSSTNGGTWSDLLQNYYDPAVFKRDCNDENILFFKKLSAFYFLLSDPNIHNGKFKIFIKNGKSKIEPITK